MDRINVDKIVEFAEQELAIARLRKLDKRQLEKMDKAVQYVKGWIDFNPDDLDPELESYVIRLWSLKPLTPIEESEDSWEKIVEVVRVNNATCSYRSKRCSSLYKMCAAKDNHIIKCIDTAAIFVVDINGKKDIPFNLQIFAKSIYYEMNPIAFPYDPTLNPMITLYVEYITKKVFGVLAATIEELIHKNKGIQTRTPMKLMRFFKITTNDYLEEISITEYQQLIDLSKKEDEDE